LAILNILNEDKNRSELRKKSRPVDKIDRRVTTLLDDMRETLKSVGGVGLAAPQVGVLRRVAIIEIDEEDLIEMINPVITVREGEQQEIEGCLSSPGKFAETLRPASVKVAYTNRNGEQQEREGAELLARAFCHEIDHLDGILCFDFALRMLTKEEVDELRREQEEDGEEQ